MTDVLVRASGLAKTYGDGGHETRAVIDTSFEVLAGERIALVGPSGSGKSTLLHLVAGIETPSAGTLEWPAFGGREQLRPGPVSMAFQGPSLLPPLSVAENVALPLLLQGVEESEALLRTWDMLDGMGLGSLGEKLPEELSGGQSQRVGLARALVTRPVLLLADEPTGQLDHDHAWELMAALFEQVSETGSAVVVATHDELIAARMSCHWSMTNGRLATAQADA
jgi:ABC-type lipoprotein export system ATPase subunit